MTGAEQAPAAAAGPGPAVMAAAAREWLARLSTEQRRAAALPTPVPGSAAHEDRIRWYYTPTDHGGLTLGEQNPVQQSLVMQLVASGLSESAYVTVAAVIGLENVLDRLEGWHVDWGRDRGRDAGLYYTRVFGWPGDRLWGWRFAGHHISLNFLLLDGRVVSRTPCFIGADPAATPLLGGTQLRPLGGCEDLARELARSLDSDQLPAALLSPRAVSDIVSGNRAVIGDGDQMIHMQDLWNGHFREQRLVDLLEDIDRRAEAQSGYDRADHARIAITRRPNGLSASAMTADQREMLALLAATFEGRAASSPDMTASVLVDPDDSKRSVHFGWAGSLEAGQPHYFRLQSETLLAEYNNTQRAANHAHSVWRDPRTDLGLAALAGAGYSTADQRGVTTWTSG